VNGLSPEQLQELSEARRRGVAVRRAVATARLNAWSIAIFAGLTLLGALVSWWGLILGLGMGVVAFNEFKGASRLRRLDADATRMLALNQLFLGVLLLTYAVYSLFTVGRGDSEIAGYIRQSPELQPVLGGVEDLARLIGYLMYGTLAAVAVFVQGGTALYYRSRRRHIEAYVQQTPAWIQQALRAGMPM
jgi:hypothetical protein